MNPLDEYLEMTKEASFGALLKGAWKGLTSAGPQQLSTLKPAGSPDAWIGAATQGLQLGRKAQAGLATAAGGAALAGGAAAFAKIRNSISKKRDFKQMMATDPELAQLQKEKPKFFNQAYSSLRNVNPTFGKDPIVAGSYMRKMMANPDAAGLTLAQSIKAPQADSGPVGAEFSLGGFKAKF
jgi:hypothetical protein